MGRYKIKATVRKNIFIAVKLYEQSLIIAEEMGLSYPEYIRHLLTLDVKRRENPPDIPIDENLPFGQSEFGSSLGGKRREKLVKVMHEIRRLL